MGMPLELNTMIVTKAREKRVAENIFTLRKSGYRLYPLNIPLQVRREVSAGASGMATIHKVEWENEETMITYELFALNTSN